MAAKRFLTPLLLPLAPNESVEKALFAEFQVRNVLIYCKEFSCVASNLDFSCRLNDKA